MRVFGGFVLTLLVSASGFAQGFHGSFNPTPVLRGGFGNVVFPGGTAATTPGLQRNFGNVAFPGGGGPRLDVPLSNQNFAFPNFSVANLGPSVGQRRGGGSRRFGGNFNGAYAIPVYVGGYGSYGNGFYGGSAYDNPYPYPADAGAPGPQQPNVIIVYPQAPAQAGFAPEPPPQAVLAQPYQQPAESGAEPAHYLIAFKDHTIYSAVAYWVDGDTLHYFTSGSTHNQVSLSLVDRDLTERLNREAGTDLKLPR